MLYSLPDKQVAFAYSLRPASHWQSLPAQPIEEEGSCLCCALCSCGLYERKACRRAWVGKAPATADTYPLQHFTDHQFQRALVPMHPAEQHFDTYLRPLIGQQHMCKA